MESRGTGTLRGFFTIKYSLLVCKYVITHFWWLLR